MFVRSYVSLCCFLVLGSFAAFPITAVAEKPLKPELAHAVLTPFWEATQLPEPILFLEENSDSKPTGKLLFKAKRIKSVTSATRKIVYQEGVDYIWNQEQQLFSLPHGSRIPFLTQELLYPLMTADTPKIGKPRASKDEKRGVYFDNKAGYHHLQVEVTYEFEPNQWNGPVPSFAGTSLPNTLKKLKQKQPVKIFLAGDSISEGYNASRFSNAAPDCPAYGELFAQTLGHHFGSQVAFKNFAVGGWSASQGLKRINDEKLAEEKPDLVIIAFGMNDVWQKNAAAYKQHVQNMIQAFREKSPETEFILVASMLGNKNWGMPMEQFDLYRNALKEQCGPGIVLADLTEIWEEFLKHKTFYDLTGNGVNHPNDFGHIVYAQVLTRLLVDSKK